MLTPFPKSRQRRFDPLGWELVLHGATAEASRIEEEDLSWATWLFQSVRARMDAIIFQTSAVERSEVLEGWEEFAAGIFLPKLAPWLLVAWGEACQGRDGNLAAAESEWRHRLERAAAGRSAEAGAILLERTRGMKHEGVLGRLRQRIARSECEGHLPTVWSAIAALFQMPPADLLSEYLHEEWLVGTKHCPHHEPPCGAVSFGGLAQKALHEARLLDFAEVEKSGLTSRTSGPSRPQASSCRRD